MSKAKGRVIKDTSNFSYLNLLWLSLVFGAIGAYVIVRSLAAPNPNLLGDLNNDNTVNGADLALLLNNYGTTNAAGDINGDGHDNVVDLSILLSHYGQSVTTGGTGTSDIASETSCPNQTNTSATAAVQQTAMICMTNYARNVDGGLRALTANSALGQAAAAKNNDIITCNDFDHTACGRNFDYWIHNYGYPGLCYGENIAYGFTTVHDTFVAWMNSEGHRENILNSNYRDIGEAVSNWSGHGPLWTTDFGGC